MSCRDKNQQKSYLDFSVTSKEVMIGIQVTGAELRFTRRQAHVSSPLGRCTSAGCLAAATPMERAEFNGGLCSCVRLLGLYSVALQAVKFQPTQVDTPSFSGPYPFIALLPFLPTLLLHPPPES